MGYYVFVNLAQKQDSRNNFEPCDIDLSFVPLPLRSFYATNNPINVEIVLCDLTSVRFSPVKFLERLQSEYDFEDSSFVFATQEGDPIYHKPNGIFRGAHGSSARKETKISNNFDSYIEMLSKDMIEKSRMYRKSEENDCKRQIIKIYHRH